MVYFAEIWTGQTREITGSTGTVETYEHNMVIRVLTISDEQEYRGEDYLVNDLGLSGTWIQTTPGGDSRGMYAGVGYFYNFDLKLFHPPQPYSSWVLNTTTGKWEPPTPKPIGGNYKWNEDTQLWVEFHVPTPSVSPNQS